MIQSAAPKSGSSVGKLLKKTGVRVTENTHFKNVEQPNNNKKISKKLNQEPQQRQHQQQKDQRGVLNISTAYGTHLFKTKAVNFKIRLKCTSEIFNVIGIPLGMTVRELKSCLEFICGIPFELQRVSYLDDG